MRDTIIFAGQSNTFGLGLEWELDPELNSDEYLNKGVHLPLPVESRRPYEKLYWKKYRWASLVCKDLGYNEFNVHDFENKPVLGSGAAETLWHLFERRNETDIKQLIDKTKYVVLEIGYIRWWDDNLHGKLNGEYLPNTPIEIENYLKLKDANELVVEAAIRWISNYDEKSFWEQTFTKIVKFQELFPEIKVILVPWTGNQHDFLKRTELYEQVKDWFIDVPTPGAINGFLQTNQLQIWNKAKAWNGNYKYNYKEEHACIEGHRLVADMLIKHIKNLENEKE